ncbi:hypothetical protein CNR22_09740 [Sphingobacteriaceae bacterium]|nr:hypothetical protein CNR22_09740 [Sphingobacteriaceae bacterium]
MQEESKQDYIARHRKHLGVTDTDDRAEDNTEIDKRPAGFKARLKSLLFLLLLALFFYAILQIFGMLKSN